MPPSRGLDLVHRWVSFEAGRRLGSFRGWWLVDEEPPDGLVRSAKNQKLMATSQAPVKVDVHTPSTRRGVGNIAATARRGAPVGSDVPRRAVAGSSGHHRAVAIDAPILCLCVAR